jgi:hypothetical protein
MGSSAAGSCYVEAVANVTAEGPRFQPPLHGRQRRLESPARADWHDWHRVPIKSQSEPQSRAKYARDWTQAHACMGLNGGEWKIRVLSKIGGDWHAAWACKEKSPCNLIYDNLAQKFTRACMGSTWTWVLRNTDAAHRFQTERVLQSVRN